MSQADNKLAGSVGDKQQAANTLALSDPQTIAAIKAYLNNGGNLEDALKGIKTGAGNVNDDAKAAQKELDAMGPPLPGAQGARDAATRAELERRIKAGTDEGPSGDMMRAAIKAQLVADPETGSLMAAQQIQSNPLMAAMFGRGGIQDQRQADEMNLTKNAYNWDAQDETAMGTAAAGINRQYAADQGNLARALSSRGFGASDSGVAASQFAGLNGNTSDRLAAAQQSLANNRMQVGLQRLTAARNAVNQAQGMAQGAMNDQFNRNMVGINRGDKQVANSWAQSVDKQSQANKEWEQQQASSFNPMDLVAGAATMGVGALTGGASSALTGALFGPKPGAPKSATTSLPASYTDDNYKLPPLGYSSTRKSSLGS